MSAILVLPMRAYAWLPVGLEEMKGTATMHAATGSRDLDDRTGLVGGGLRLQSTVKLGDKISLIADGYIHFTDFRESFSETSRAREAYIAYYGDTLDIRFGRQIIVWGRADRLQPLDFLTPRDYTYLTSLEQEQRFGNDGLEVKYYYSDTGTLTGLFFFGFHASKLPRNLVSTDIQIQELDPDVSLGDPEWGVRWDDNLKGLDLGIAYYEGRSLLPAIGVRNFSLARVNPRIQVLALDFAKNLGSWLVRGDIAYSSTDREGIESDPSRYSSLYSVLGVDTSLFRDANLGIQFINKFIDGLTDRENLSGPAQAIAFTNAAINNEFDAVTSYVSLNLNKRLSGDKIAMDLGSIVNLNAEEYALTAKLIYSVSDNVKAVLYAEWFDGAKDTFFGVFDRNRIAMTELRITF